MSQKNYTISDNTAEFVECLLQADELYTRCANAVLQMYDHEEPGEKLGDLFAAFREELETFMTASIRENLMTLSNNGNVI